MFKHQTHIRVRYAETDQMGYMYYGHYPTYYEVARAEMIRSVGLSYQAMEKQHGILMPVMSLNIRYVRPAHYDELLRLETSVNKIPSNTITFLTDIYNENNDLINGGKVKLCFVDASTGERIDAPDFLTDAIKQHF